MGNFESIVRRGYSESHYRLYPNFDDRFNYAVCSVLDFLLSKGGSLADESVDAYIYLYSILNNGLYEFSLDDVESVIAQASELGIVNYILDKQCLVGLELGEDSPVYCALIEESTKALDCAVCLSKNKNSRFNSEFTLAGMCLFGEWEEMSTVLISSILQRRKLYGRVHSVRHDMKIKGVEFQTDILYADFLKKLELTRLLHLRVDMLGRGVLHLNPVSCGLFLVSTDNLFLASCLSELM